MTDKDQQVYPVSQNQTTQAKQDVESATMDSKELRKKKRMKCLAYVAAFAVFQTAIILIFVLTIMKIRTPKFRVRSANFESFEVTNGTATADPSFNLRMDAQLGVKNANFGNYKFHNSTIVFSYDGTTVGQADVRKTKAGWRSTKKLNVVVDLSSNDLSSSSKSKLRNEINSAGVLTLNSRSRLNGKVELIFIFKKKKSIDMNCTLTIGLAEKAVKQISCK